MKYLNRFIKLSKINKAIFYLTLCLLLVVIFYTKNTNSISFGDDTMGILAIFKNTQNQEYVYLNSGETLNMEIAFAPNSRRNFNGSFSMDIYSPDGEIVGNCSLNNLVAPDDFGKSCSVSFVADMDGIYDFLMPNNIMLKFNNISVVDSEGKNISGRVWTNSLNIVQGEASAIGSKNTTPISTLKNLEFYAVNDAGNIYDIKFYNYQGIGSTIEVNANGNVSDENSCTSSYISTSQTSTGFIVPGDPDYVLPSLNCTKYRLFYEAPNSDLPPSALSRKGELLILPVLKHNSNTELNDLQPSLDRKTILSDIGFIDNREDLSKKDGVIILSVNPNFTGNIGVEVYIDKNKNGEIDLNDQKVRNLSIGAMGGELNSSLKLKFDGEDSEGVDIPVCDQLIFAAKVDKIGEIHLTLNDLEMSSGLSIIAVNGDNAGDATVYWNDTKLSTGLSENGFPISHVRPYADATSGVDSSIPGGVHGWVDNIELEVNGILNNSQSSYRGWGDNRLIDTWTYQSISDSDLMQYVSGPDNSCSDNKAEVLPEAPNTGFAKYNNVNKVLAVGFVTLIVFAIISRKNMKRNN